MQGARAGSDGLRSHLGNLYSVLEGLDSSPGYASNSNFPAKAHPREAARWELKYLETQIEF